MAALLCRFEPGEEVIMPSFTHAGTANAFERAGATLVFADSLTQHPNVDPEAVRSLIGPRTKAIVAVHYAGVACDMDALVEMSETHGLVLIEDAAHAIGASYKGRLLGSIGHLGAYSFHETKNITCGQGGLLMVNDSRYASRALRIWENGTNRADFYKGLVDHYTWVDTGACFLPSDMNAAYLSGQLRHREEIFSNRLALWERYRELLTSLGGSLFELPWVLPGEVGKHNAHTFYLSCRDEVTRDGLLHFLNAEGYGAVFHYIPLHNSPHFRGRHSGGALPNCDRHSRCLLRLPLFHSLSFTEVQEICSSVGQFVLKNRTLS